MLEGLLLIKKALCQLKLVWSFRVTGKERTDSSIDCYDAYWVPTLKVDDLFTVKEQVKNARSDHSGVLG